MQEESRLRFRIGPEELGRRVDLVVLRRLPHLSRAFCQKLIREGLVTLNGQRVKPSHGVRRDEEVLVRIPPPREPGLRPENIPLNILYEDEWLLVVNKPPGLVVHPAAGHNARTLVHGLLHHCRGRLSGVGGEARPGIVHRLDKDTSGCLLVAKDDATHRALAAQFQQRQVCKEYLAVVWGAVSAPRGRLESAIGRSRHHRHKMTVRAVGGKPALTEFEVLERFRDCTVLRVTILTGRTHQIRVHLASLGHPVVGDAVYGRKRPMAWAAAVPRQMLHAHRLVFVHPRSGRMLELTAPLPSDFKDLLDRLRGDLRRETVPR